MKMTSGAGDCADRGPRKGADSVVTSATSSRLTVRKNLRIVGYIVGRAVMCLLNVFRSEA